ncbi:uncharacterized protein LOC125067950 [Vanessa atalanta]|uniref:uncharacterized protein LOC125067950 n=1 Tax=Vanessa atalanta TaxID=42275 RepID=UPI001FCDE84E|nr:uncharacterized protein LOC125067950 [Vanessa atalanta]
MLINRVKEEDESVNEKGTVDKGHNLEEYQTANELYDIMTQNNPHNLNVLKSEARDLVILYENIDVGTKLISSTINKASNQYVETIIYNDDPDSEDSDVCELYSNEDLKNIFAINNERIDFLSNIPSFENSLCQKFGNQRMKTSNFSNEYEKHFLFNDPFIKEQLQSLHAMTASKQSDSAVLPMSLLDYICCKRVEENYNFYMDNIINYVQNTIEQLKRISNGDYLTDRVKEKWREVKGEFVNNTNKSNKHIPLSSTDNSPLPIVGKCSDQVFFTWDEIVHSEMDIRCLSKILEKKIIVEIPKLLCGSYKLFTKRCKDNLTLSCKRTNNRVTHVIKEKPSVDILVNLQRSETGHMNRNINSVIVLQSIRPSLARKESRVHNFVALRLKEIESNKEENLKIIELDDNDNSIIQENDRVKNATNISTELDDVLSSRNDSKFKSDMRCSLTPSDELGRAMHRLNIQSSVLEENEDDSIKKKRSPTRIRIKSPYENKSFVLDERKRKRLLEIRERREKKKLAMNESCKITKHKFVKGAVMAQSSNSVTKLSITNKSFYNSIYGHNNIANKNFNKNVINEQEKEPNLTLDIEECHEEYKKDQSTVSLGKNGQKYINRSYYLDDADTEIMYLQMKQNNDEDDTMEILTPSTSVLSSDVGAKLSGFRNFINLSTTDLSGTDTTSSLHQNTLFENSPEYMNKQNSCQLSPHFMEVQVPSNTPKKNDSTRIDKCKKITMSVECRKSIDKIYDLMKKITVSPISLENKQNDIQIINNIQEKEVMSEGMENVTIQENESGTSFKLQLTSSNPSRFGNENRNYVFEAQRKFPTKKTETSTTIVPKVVISSKFQTDKVEKIDHKTKKVNKKVDSKLADNPLRAISQLLHEFDSVQKTRYKNGKEVKSLKKNDNITATSRQFASKVASCEEKNIKRSEQGNSRFFKPLSPTKDLKISHLKPGEEKTMHKKKLADIIDEVKEMRGEAVRGPSKRPILSSRIDNLAQPKRSYVKAHHDDFQNRYSRNTIPKVQKSPIASVLVHEKPKRANYKNKHREGIEIEQRLTKEIKKNGPSLEKPRRAYHKSPVRNEKSPSMSANRLPNNSNDKNATHLLNNKMVAVETYVKSHFERVLSTRNQGNKNIVHKSRVPLIPLDIDIASLTSSPIGEESTSLGNKLHKMVNAKIIPHSLALSPFSEYKENPSETDKDEKVESIEHLSKRSTTISTDYLVDIFEDKNIVTAVECVSKEDNNAKIDQTKNDNVNIQSSEELNSYNVLQKLENALYRQMSNGTFQKRLRLKNLTLTPKQSMQQVFLLHSGDAGSLIVKSKISQKLNFSQTDIIPKFDMLPVVSPDSINILPMQIATVGYVFPTYQFFKNKLSNKSNILKNKDFATSLQITTSKNNSWMDKSVDCYKENNERQSLTQNTDQGIDSCNVNVGCSKESSNLLNENTEQPEIKQKGDKIESDDVRTKNCDSINNSTSLDLLVRLLNEIKKITTCQSNLVTAVNDNDTYGDNKELKIILNKAGALDNSLDQSVKDSISISSLENQRYLHPSNFSLYLQSNVDDYLDKYKFTQDIKNNNVNDIQALLVDKEINVQKSLKQIMHTFTDVPSRFFPSKVNRSTHVSSLIAMVNKTSFETVCSFSDCHVLYSNSTFNNIKTWPYVNKTQSLTSSICKKEKLEGNIKKQNKPKNILQASRVQVISDNKTSPEVNIHDKSFNTLQEFNPLLRMKRDVLVTVYSILVFTVFAALTIPDIISHS